MPDVPMVPKPPPLETAATSAGDVAEPMPPRTMGWVMPRRSQMRVCIMVSLSHCTLRLVSFTSFVHFAISDLM